MSSTRAHTAGPGRLGTGNKGGITTPLVSQPDTYHDQEFPPALIRETTFVGDPWQNKNPALRRLGAVTRRGVRSAVQGGLRTSQLGFRSTRPVSLRLASLSTNPPVAEIPEPYPVLPGIPRAHVWASQEAESQSRGPTHAAPSGEGADAQSVPNPIAPLHRLSKRASTLAQSVSVDSPDGASNAVVLPVETELEDADIDSLLGRGDTPRPSSADVAPGSTPRPYPRDDPLPALMAGRVDPLPTPPRPAITLCILAPGADMAAERHALWCHVIPEIQELVGSLHLNLEIKDLHFGMSEKESLDSDVIDACNKEIETYRNNTGYIFLCLFGDRYGRCPLPCIISGTVWSAIHRVGLADTDNASLLEAAYTSSEFTEGNWMCRSVDTIMNEYNKQHPSNPYESWQQLHEDIYSLLSTATARAVQQQALTESDSHTVSNGSVVAHLLEQGLQDLSDNDDHVLIYQRTLDGLRLDDESARIYIDTVMDQGKHVLDEASRTTHSDMQSSIRKWVSDANIRLFECEWKPGGVDCDRHPNHRAYIHKLRDSLRSHLTKLITRASTNITDRTDPRLNLPLSQEVLHHAQISMRRGDDDVGQDDACSNVEEFWKHKIKRQRPIVLQGPENVSKASIVARLHKDIASSKCVCVVRYLGTSPASQSIKPMLIGICTQICLAYNFNQIEPRLCDTDSIFRISQAFNLLLIDLGISDCTLGRPLYIMLDSPEKLNSADLSHTMLWFPRTCPFNVHILTTTTYKSDIHDRLVTIIKDPDCFINTEHLTTTEQKVESAHNPLFLEIWKDMLLKTPVGIADEFTLSDVVQRYFESLEAIFGKVLVSKPLVYLTLAYDGLCDQEMDDLLSCSDDVLDKVYTNHISSAARVSCLLWSGLKDRLENVLAQHESQGKVVYYWRHDAFKQHVYQQYIKSQTVEYVQSIHEDLATIFRTENKLRISANLRGQNTTIKEAERFVTIQPLVPHNYRKLVCYPYHLFHSRGLSVLKKSIFGNLQWLMMKLEGCGLSAVAADYTVVADKLHATDSLKSIFRTIQVVMKNHNASHLQLPSELITRLSSLRGSDDVVNSLLCQAEEFIALYRLPMVHPVYPCLSVLDNERDILIDGSQWIYNVSPDDKYVLAKNKNHQVHLLSMEDSEIISVLDTVDNSTFEMPAQRKYLAMSPDGQYIVAVEGSDVYIWQTHTGWLCKSFNPYEDSSGDKAIGGFRFSTLTFSGIALNQDASKIVTVKNNNTLIVIDRTMGEVIHEFHGRDDNETKANDSTDDAPPSGHPLKNKITKLAFSGDYSKLITADNYGTTCVWTPGDERFTLLHTLQNDSDNFQVSHNGKTLIIKSGQFQLNVYDLPTGHLRARIETHNMAIGHALLSNNGRFIVMLVGKKSLKMFDIAYSDDEKEFETVKLSNDKISEERNKDGSTSANPRPKLKARMKDKDRNIKSANPESDKAKEETTDVPTSLSDSTDNNIDNKAENNNSATVEDTTGNMPDSNISVGNGDLSTDIDTNNNNENKNPVTDNIEGVNQANQDTDHTEGNSSDEERNSSIPSNQDNNMSSDNIKNSQQIGALKNSETNGIGTDGEGVIQHPIPPVLMVAANRKLPLIRPPIPPQMTNDELPKDRSATPHSQRGFVDSSRTKETVPEIRDTLSLDPVTEIKLSAQEEMVQFYFDQSEQFIIGDGSGGHVKVWHIPSGDLVENIYVSEQGLWQSFWNVNTHTLYTIHGHTLSSWRMMPVIQRAQLKYKRYFNVPHIELSEGTNKGQEHSPKSEEQMPSSVSGAELYSHFDIKQYRKYCLAQEDLADTDKLSSVSQMVHPEAGAAYSCVQLDTTGQHFVTTKEGLVQVWSAADAQLQQQVAVDRCGLLTVGRQGSILVCGVHAEEEDQLMQLQFYDLTDGRRLDLPGAGGDPFCCEYFTLSRNTNILHVIVHSNCGRNTGIVSMDLTNLQVVHQIQAETAVHMVSHRASSMLVSDDDNVVVTGSKRKIDGAATFTPYILDRNQDIRQMTSDIHSGVIRIGEMSTLTNGFVNTLGFGKVEENAREICFDVDVGKDTTLFISNNELLTGTNTGHLTIWSAATRKITRCLSRHAPLSAEYQAELSVAQAQPHPRHCHAPSEYNSAISPPPITCVALSGRRLATARADGTLSLWDMTSEQFVCDLIGHEGAVSCCAVSRDGSHVVSGGEDLTIRVWEWNNPTQLYCYVTPLPLTRLTLTPTSPPTLTACTNAGVAQGVIVLSLNNI